MKLFLTRVWIVAFAVLALAGAPLLHSAAKQSEPASIANKSSAKPAKAQTATAAKPPARKTGVARNPYVGAIAVDADSRVILLEDQADARGYPASVLKLMDLLIIIEQIKAGRLTLDTPVPVSARAAKTGGSQVWLAENETFTVDELLYALMVQSANDAAVALAEKVAGSCEAFTQLMNQRAQQLSMTNTVFRSVHGLPPAAGQQHDVTTPRDFARLCLELLKHPEVLRYTSTRERPFRPNVPGKNVVMRTHNHLLGAVNGCDGLKTGYTAAAGFSIAVTASRNGRRVVVVVLGSTDRKVRDAKAAELVNKAFAMLPPAPVPTPVMPATNPPPAQPVR